MHQHLHDRCYIIYIIVILHAAAVRFYLSSTKKQRNSTYLTPNYAIFAIEVDSLMLFLNTKTGRNILNNRSIKPFGNAFIFLKKHDFITAFRS